MERDGEKRTRSRRNRPITGWQIGMPCLGNRDLSYMGETRRKNSLGGNLLNVTTYDEKRAEKASKRLAGAEKYFRRIVVSCWKSTKDFLHLPGGCMDNQKKADEVLENSYRMAARKRQPTLAMR